jgi:carbohydrate diacid regulator
MVEKYLGPLTPGLRQTAAVFLAGGLSIAQAATSLNIHRNTVVQRLDRIEVLTGLNLREFHGALRMHHSVLAAAASAVHSAHTQGA